MLEEPLKVIAAGLKKSHDLHDACSHSTEFRAYLVLGLGFREEEP